MHALIYNTGDGEGKAFTNTTSGVRNFSLLYKSRLCIILFWWVVSCAIILKVAEHSFCAHFYLCDSARAQGLQIQTCRQQSDHFIYSKPALSALFFSIIKRSVLMPLFCYYRDMLGKVTTQTTQKFLAFLC